MRTSSLMVVFPNGMDDFKRTRLDGPVAAVWMSAI